MEVLQQRVERQEDAIQARGTELDALNRMYQRDLSDQFVAEEQAAGEDLPPVRLHPDFEETGLVAGLSGLLARFQKTVAIELAVDVDLQQGTGADGTPSPRGSSPASTGSSRRPWTTWSSTPGPGAPT